MFAERVRRALNATTSAAECLSLAAESDSPEHVELKRECLQRAVALDRSSQAALLNLAALSLDEGDATSTFCLVEEAARVAPLPPEVRPLHEHLLGTAAEDPQLEPYLQAIGKRSGAPAEETLSILVLASGYRTGPIPDAGSHAGELAQVLAQRGHDVRVLTGEASSADAVQAENGSRIQVLRTLQLAGTGAAGGTHQVETQRTRDNAARVRTAISKSEADVVLAADLSGLGIAILRPALERGVPVLHLVSTARPGFSVEEQPADAHYAIAPASDWTGTALRNAGYETQKMDTLYPGIRTDRCFRLFLPDTQQLRVCFSGSLRANSGAGVLLDALAQLKQQKVRVTATFAVDAQDGGDVQQFEARVGTLGLDKSIAIESAVSGDHTAMLARHNVLVHAGAVPEAFAALLPEAMAAGVIVVTSGSGGAKEIVRDGVDGLYFRSGDAADLAKQLVALANDGERFKQLQRAGQSRAMQFSIQESAKRFEELARDLREARKQLEAQAENDGLNEP